MYKYVCTIYVYIYIYLYIHKYVIHLSRICIVILNKVLTCVSSASKWEKNTLYMGMVIHFWSGRTIGRPICLGYVLMFTIYRGLKVVPGNDCQYRAVIGRFIPTVELTN